MGNAPKLEQLSGDRDNNFNLLRFCAATTVILGHSILLSGNPASSLGWALGYAAVNCFFVISGFLVSRSLLRRDNLRAYLLARILRIYPALIAVVLLCVFLLGLWLTPVSADVFLSHSQTREFLWHNSILLIGETQVHLPGVFSDSPFPGQVNAPLWTLQYEVAMYLGLAAVFVVCRVAGGESARSLFRFIILAITTAFMLLYLVNVAGDEPRTGVAANTLRFGAMFFSGAALYLFRRHVRMGWPLALLLAGLAMATHEIRPVFVSIAWLSLPYIVLFLAYIPGGMLRRFNRLGDYSYGLYIMAFPVQQLLVTTWPGMHTMSLFAAAMALTLPMAVLSWHGLEKPVLSLKERLAKNYSSAATMR